MMEPLSEDLQATLRHALRGSGRAIAAFMGLPVKLRERRAAIEDVLQVATPYGDPDAAGAGAYVAMVGDLTGHCLLLMPEASTSTLWHLAEEQFGPMDETLRASFLQEVSNLAVSGFLTTLADPGGWHVTATPPELTWSSYAALVQSVVAAMAAETDHALVATADGRVAGRGFDCSILVLPDAHGLAALLEAWR